MAWLWSCATLAFTSRLRFQAAVQSPVLLLVQHSLVEKYHGKNQAVVFCQKCPWMWPMWTMRIKGVVQCWLAAWRALWPRCLPHGRPAPHFGFSRCGRLHGIDQYLSSAGWYFVQESLPFQNGWWWWCVAAAALKVNKYWYVIGEPCENGTWSWTRFTWAIYSDCLTLYFTLSALITMYYICFRRCSTARAVFLPPPLFARLAARNTSCSCLTSLRGQTSFLAPPSEVKHLCVLRRIL